MRLGRGEGGGYRTEPSPRWQEAIARVEDWDMTVMWTLVYSEDKNSYGFRERWYLSPTLHMSPPTPSANPSYLCLGQAA